MDDFVIVHDKTYRTVVFRDDFTGIWRPRVIATSQGSNSRLLFSVARLINV